MDSIANMLSQLKNSSMVGHATVEVPFSKMNQGLLNLLQEQQFIGEVRMVGKKADVRSIVATLIYGENGKPAISHLRRISKPGQRVYCDKKSLSKWNQGRGVKLISTSRGLMTVSEAKARDIGGELICEVY